MHAFEVIGYAAGALRATEVRAIRGGFIVPADDKGTWAVRQVTTHAMLPAEGGRPPARRGNGARPSGIAQALAQDRLGVRAVVFYVMTAVAPLTVVAGILPTAYAVTGLLGLPIACVVVGVALSIWSVGYVAMARHLPHAGPFYAYVSHGLGKIPGVGAAWVSILAYNCLTAALHGGIGGYAALLVARHTGVSAPWWIYSLAAWALVFVLGLCRVDLPGALLAVLLVIEVVVIAVYDIAFVAAPGPQGFATETLSPANLLHGGVGALLAIAVLGFTGFETTVVFSEESKNPSRTIPTATFVSIAFITAVYSVSAWAMAVSTGSAGIVATAGKHVATGDLLFALADRHLGRFLSDVGTYLMLTSIFAALLSFHNTTARYAFALGRERVIPSFFGGTTSLGVPRVGSMVQSVLGLLFIACYALIGLDPLVQGFYALGTAGGFGVLILITWSAYAIFFYFRRHPQPEENAWRTTAAPLLAALLSTCILAVAVLNIDTMLGVPPSHPLRWLIPLTFFLAALAGMGYGLWLRTARRLIYAAIGMGAKSTTTSVLAAPRSVAR